jgi:hypothetical protein
MEPFVQQFSPIENPEEPKKKSFAIVALDFAASGVIAVDQDFLQMVRGDWSSTHNGGAPGRAPT